MEVYIDGVQDTNLSLSNILPREYGSPTLKFTKQKASYDVTILIGEVGKSPQNYKKYTVNGETGKVTEIRSYEFVYSEDTQVTTEPTEPTEPRFDWDNKRR